MKAIILKIPVAVDLATPVVSGGNDKHVLILQLPEVSLKTCFPVVK